MFKKINVNCFLIAIGTFFFSLILLGYFDAGDQKHYIDFYQGVSSLDLYQGYLFYQNTLGSSEPIYFLLVYFFSGFISKNLFIAIANGILLYFLYLWLYRVCVSKFIWILIFFNFYIMVLLFSAERLKFSLIFFLISVFLGGFKGVFLYLLVILTHVQTSLLVFLKILNDLSFRFKAISVPFFILFLFFFIVVIFYLRSHIYDKLLYYSGDIYDLIKPFVFLILTIYYSFDKKLVSFFQSSVILLAAYFVGDERVVIFSYFLFMYYALQYKKGLNLGVLSTSIYFFIKGIIFIYNIFVYGDGFNALGNL